VATLTYRRCPSLEVQSQQHSFNQALATWNVLLHKAILQRCITIAITRMDSNYRTLTQIVPRPTAWNVKWLEPAPQ
jgi:hypothetical protein